jgi:cytochrome P450
LSHNSTNELDSSTLLFAGYETTTYVISRILWILASRPDAQARLRTEIRSAKRVSSFQRDSTEGWEDVSLSYDELSALPYLDAVIRETLRVHPPSSVHFRVYDVLAHFVWQSA